MWHKYKKIIGKRNLWQIVHVAADEWFEELPSNSQNEVVYMLGVICYQSCLFKMAYNS